MSGKLPESFHLEHDPFPHLITRDALLVASEFMRSDCYEPGQANLETELARIPTLEEPQIRALRSFIEINDLRYEHFTWDVRQGYFAFWSTLWEICHQHLLESRYGNGDDQPDPDSSDASYMKARDIHYAPQLQEAIRFGQECIDAGEYLPLVALALETELDNPHRFDQDSRIANAFAAGCHAAHADALLLLTMLENPQASPR